MNILIDGQTLETPEVNRGIGVYFKNVLNNLVKQSYENNWFITVSDSSCLNVLDPWVVKRLNIINDEVFTPSSDYNCSEKYTDMIQEIVIQNKIDIFWDPNPLMVNVLFINKPISCNVYVTIHDLIPLIMPVKEWSVNVRNEYKRRLNFMKEERVYCLYNSEATKSDFLKHINPEAHGWVTLLAADSKRFYRKREHRKTNSNIVFTGGFDYRKNIFGAIEAFIKMKDRYRDIVNVQNAKLYIVCSYDEASKKRIEKKLSGSNLKEDVVFTGFISDEDLAALYQEAAVFFFPSLYEGFGLPLVEAMLGGAYILSADNSCLPEICSEYALFCNASDSDDMADKLYKSLINSAGESLDAIHLRQGYALGFSWDETSLRTLSAFDYQNNVPGHWVKKKIAIATPWLHQRTGIASFMYCLVPYLQKYFNIDIFVDIERDKMSELKEMDGVSLYNITDLEGLLDNYEEVVYQIGNNSEFHTNIYNVFCKYPGIVEIHDFVLNPFMYHSFYLKHKQVIYQEALVAGYGEEGLRHYQNIVAKKEHPDNERFPMSHSIAKTAKKTIVHNHWSKDQIPDSENVSVIPLPCFEKSIFFSKEKNAIKEMLLKRILRQENDIIIGCYGFVNKNKRPEKIVEVVKQLIEEGYSIKLVFWGKTNDNTLLELIKKQNLTQQVFITGYLDKEEYESSLEICDIVVNLRFPSMGEASATLCEALKYGKPVLVSDINQYQEYPDEVCWKVPVNFYEIPVLKEMLRYLIEHPDVREALGGNAEKYAENVLSPEKIAKLYAQSIGVLEKEK